MRAAFADVNHGRVVALVQAATDDLGQEYAMIARINVPGWLAFEVTQRLLQNRYTPGTVCDLESLKCRSAGLETLPEMLQECLLALVNQIQNKRLALG
jgi:hypothetical protein